MAQVQSPGTVHPFFSKIKSRGDLVNWCIRERNSTCKQFTQIFKVFFPGDVDYNDNVCSWLQLISSNFYFPKKNVSENTQRRIDKLFDAVQISIRDNENQRVYEFFLYLNMVYEILTSIEYQRDDNIFEFFTGTNFNQVKVVFVGQDPAPGVPSSGYAFHLSNCETTKLILKQACQEVNYIRKAMNKEMLDDVFVNHFKQRCDMESWINNGVLLINSCLTYHEHSRFQIRKAWEEFTHFILKQLNFRRTNIVFVLVGDEASNKKRLVDKERHLVICIHHPGRILRGVEMNSNKDWHRSLAFINANFYRYQIGIGFSLINWVPVTTESALVLECSAKNFFGNLIRYSRLKGLQKVDSLTYYAHDMKLSISRSFDDNDKLALRYDGTADNFSQQTTTGASVAGADGT